MKAGGVMEERLADLFLPPAGPSGRNRWFVGAVRVPEASFVLCVMPDRHETFSSLISIFEHFRAHVGPDVKSLCEALIAELRQVHEGGTANQGSQAAALSSFVSKSIIRRISRESVHTAPLIEKAAQLLRAVVSGLRNIDQVVVPDVDRLDRPTLKVITRAVLCQSPKVSIRWSFGSATDPTAEPTSSDIYEKSRCNLLRLLYRLSRSEVCLVGKAKEVRRPAVNQDMTLESITHALIYQNYDAVFIWAQPYLEAITGPEKVEALRLMGLAAANVGAKESAQEWLAQAEQLTNSASKKAEFAYLQGLLAAKRDYDLTASDNHYSRGRALLTQDEDDKISSKELAMAWLYNGMALNEAVRARREGSPAGLERASDLLRDSLRLISAGDDSDRHYLRSNLIANAAFLYEIRKDFDAAIEILESAFKFPIEGGIGIRERLSSTLGYRIGVLQFKNGQAAAALATLAHASTQHDATTNWSIQEKILRAVGCIHIATNEPALAEIAFRKGFRLCCNARARLGASVHAGGLLQAINLQSNSKRRCRYLTMKMSREGLKLTDCPTQLLLSPKLPAYIPEIDLEDIPIIDINKFLSGTHLGSSKLAGGGTKCA